MKKQFKIFVVVSALIGVISGCSLTIDGDIYKQQAPKFDLVEFFDGNVTAWGIVQNRSGEVVQRFIVDIDGSFEDGVLVLDETFEYIVGEGVTKRVWRLTQNTDGSFTGSAGDIA